MEKTTTPSRSAPSQPPPEAIVLPIIGDAELLHTDFAGEVDHLLARVEGIALDPANSVYRYNNKELRLAVLFCLVEQAVQGGSAVSHDEIFDYALPEGSEGSEEIRERRREAYAQGRRVMLTAGLHEIGYIETPALPRDSVKRIAISLPPPKRRYSQVLVLAAPNGTKRIMWLRARRDGPIIEDERDFAEDNTEGDEGVGKL